MRFLSVLTLCVTMATASFSETPSVQSTETKPRMTQYLIAKEAAEASSSTGVTFPLTLISWGTIIAGPVGPMP